MSKKKKTLSGVAFAMAQGLAKAGIMSPAELAEWEAFTLPDLICKNCKKTLGKRFHLSPDLENKFCSVECAKKFTGLTK